MVHLKLNGQLACYWWIEHNGLRKSVDQFEFGGSFERHVTMACHWWIDCYGFRNTCKSMLKAVLKDINIYLWPCIG